MTDPSPFLNTSCGSMGPSSASPSIKTTFADIVIIVAALLAILGTMNRYNIVSDGDLREAAQKLNVASGC
jgi:uncharacterized membrane protein YidH (DUF202 family)